MAAERPTPVIESPRRNENFGAEKPDFDCEFYTMAISDNPNGFELTTIDSLPRRDDYTKPLPKDLRAEWQPVFDSEGNQVFKKDKDGKATTTPLMVDVNPNRTNLRIGMQAQMRGFTRASLTQELLHDYRKNPTPENKAKFEEAQRFTKSRNTHTTGLRQFRRDEKDKNKIGVVLRPVSFHMYDKFSFDNFDDELLQMAANASTTVAIITADNKLVVQHRNVKNLGWGDTPAASASGYLDEVGFETKNGRRVLKPIDTQIAIDNAVREIEEEIGVGKDKLTSIKLAAMVHERENVHDELLYVAKSSLTSEQMIVESRNSIKNKPLEPEDFAEKYDFIDATPEAIEKFLTEVICPIPFSHSAVFVSAGYSLMFERSGKQAAEAWKKKVEIGVKNNYRRINSIVSNFYRNNPEKLNDIPKYYMDRVESGIEAYLKTHPTASKQEIDEEKQKLVASIPKRNPNGFSKYYLPQDQGLQPYPRAMRQASILN